MRPKRSVSLPRQPPAAQNMGNSACVLLEKAAQKRVAVNYPEIPPGGAECRTKQNYLIFENDPLNIGFTIPDRLVFEGAQLKRIELLVSHPYAQDMLICLQRYCLGQ